MKVATRGRQKTKRFLGDMDDWGGGFCKEWGANILQSLVISAVAVNVTMRGTIIEVVAQGAKERDKNEMVMVV